MIKRLTITASILAGTAVLLGALNAHYFKQFFTPELSQSFDTGVRYQIYHALALLGLIPLIDYFGLKNIKRVSILFIIGTLLFSGSIYALSGFKSSGIIGLTGLGILTPIGGLVLLAAWFYLIVIAIKR